MRRYARAAQVGPQVEFVTRETVMGVMVPTTEIRPLLIASCDVQPGGDWPEGWPEGYPPSPESNPES